MRGCERRIYHVRSADSPWFEEAYLVIRRREGRRTGTASPGRDRSVRPDESERLRASAGGGPGIMGDESERVYTSVGREAGTMAEEAERIIRESTERYLRERRRAPIRRLSPPLAFALGAGSASLLIGAAALIGVLL